MKQKLGKMLAMVIGLIFAPCALIALDTAKMDGVSQYIKKLEVAYQSIKNDMQTHGVADTADAIEDYLLRIADNISLNQYLYFLFREATENDFALTKQQPSAESYAYLQNVFTNFLGYIGKVAGLPKYRTATFDAALRYAKREFTVWEKAQHIAYSTAKGAAVGAAAGALIGPGVEFMADPVSRIKSPNRMSDFLTYTAPGYAKRTSIVGAGVGGMHGLYRGVTTRNNLTPTIPAYSQPLLERYGLRSRRKGTQ